MILYMILMLFYVAICIGGFKFYFYLQEKNKAHSYGRLAKGSVSYLYFAILIFAEIPFAIFFPFWLNTKLKVFESGQMTSVTLLLIGCAILGGALWFGKKYRPNDF